MINIAALITCFNRKEKTLRCISDIYGQAYQEDILIDIYVVDGGSSDGTPQAIKERYPGVQLEVQKGLYWAGGMRAAWERAAKKKQYDFFWLINDDTHLYPDCLQTLLETDSFSLETFQQQGIYIGSTIDSQSKRFSYGGRKLLQWGKLSSQILLPNGEVQSCDLGNANIMLVPYQVYSIIGELSKEYTHGIADYDYTLRAVQNKIPVLIAPRYCGECTDDHGENWLSAPHSIKKRIDYLYSPKGLAYKEYLSYIKKFFPREYFFAAVKLWGKTLVPILWDKKTTKRKASKK